MPSRAAVAASTSATTSASSVGQHAAVGVAQRDDVGAGLGGGAHDLERVRRVVAVAVEEVLGVEEDPLALGDAGARRVSRTIARFSSQRRPQRQLDVPVVAFATSVTTGAPDVEQRADRAGRRRPRAPGRRVAPNAASVACWRSSSVCARAKNSVSLGFAPGQPPSMKPDAELVEVTGDRQLVRDGERQALLLGAVAQGRVVDVERVVHGQLLFGTEVGESSEARKSRRPPTTWEVCAAGAGRLPRRA